jgi:hypothetical protein
MKNLSLKFKVKNTRIYSKRIRKPIDPEKKFLENTKYVINKIKTGDYNPNYKQHAMKAKSAIKRGYLDKELNILKEV